MTDEIKHKDVLLLLIEGNSVDDIVEFLGSKGISRKKSLNLINEAFDDLAARGTMPVDIVIGWCFESLRLLYRKMYETGDYVGALRAIKQIEALSLKKIITAPLQDDKQREAAISQLKKQKISFTQRK